MNRNLIWIISGVSVLVIVILIFIVMNNKKKLEQQNQLLQQQQSQQGGEANIWSIISGISAVLASSNLGNKNQ